MTKARVSLLLTRLIFLSRAILKDPQHLWLVTHTVAGALSLIKTVAEAGHLEDRQRGSTTPRVGGLGTPSVAAMVKTPLQGGRRQQWESTLRYTLVKV